MRHILFSLTIALATLKAVAAPGWDFDGVRTQAHQLILRGDYKGLEALVSDIRNKGYDIRQPETELSAFYEGVIQTPDNTDAEMQDRFKLFQAWQKAIPDSLAVKIAIANWHLSMAWAARGHGFADTITDQASAIMAKELKQSVATLNEAAPATIGDPEFYITWISACLLSGPDKSATMEFFKKGVTLAKEYEPLYDSMVNYLLPKWYGAPNEAEDFITNSAKQFSGDKADDLYAFLTYDEAHETGGLFFNTSSLNYERAKNAFLSMMGGNTPADWSKVSQSREKMLARKLTFVAFSKDDKELTKRLLLDLEGRPDIISTFYSMNDYQQARKECWVADAMADEHDLERAGKLAEAEKLLISFSSDPATYPPLTEFYERQGIKDKFAAMKAVLGSGIPAEQMKAPVDQAPPDVLRASVVALPLFGEWDKAKAAAQRFDSLRPNGLTGKNALLLCAINSMDAAAAKNAIQSIIDLKTDEEPYQVAQQVLSGKKSWWDLKDSFDGNQVDTCQAITAIALYYISIGKVNLVHDIVHYTVDYTVPRCDIYPDIVIAESLEYGSLSRSLKLLAKPTPSPDPAAIPTASRSPSASGTN